MCDHVYDAKLRVVRQALHHGMRGAFSVLLTHYDLNLEAVTRESFDSTFSLEEIQEILVRFGPAVDQLAATMEEEVLPNRGGHWLGLCPLARLVITPSCLCKYSNAELMLSSLTFG